MSDDSGHLDRLQAISRGARGRCHCRRPQRCIRFWNPAAERLFGLTEAEALGNSLDLIVPERFRERHWAGYKDVLRVPAVHKDGPQRRDRLLAWRALFWK